MQGRDTYYDYIRALAALLVLFGHKGKMPGGFIGISIFFCLSGFLITRVLMGLPDLSLANLAKFIFRRWMRIFPLYLAAIIATYFLMREFRPDLLETFQAYLPGMLTFTSYPSMVGFSAAVFWTLHAEFWFYVIFPFVFAVCYRRNLMMPVAVALIAASMVAKASVGHVAAAAFTPWLTLVYLDQLMYGCICALLISKRSGLIATFQSKWWFWGALIINILVGKFAHYKEFDALWYFETSGAALLCAVAILHHAASPSDPKNNFIAWTGRISFSIYLVHGIVLDYFPADKIPEKLDTPSFVFVVLALSALTERFIERPGIRLSKALAKFRPRAAAFSSGNSQRSIV
jgi:peptidoglycan/LPS O-acetylase OafA/YrhL